MLRLWRYIFQINASSTTDGLTALDPTVSLDLANLPASPHHIVSIDQATDSSVLPDEEVHVPQWPDVNLSIIDQAQHPGLMQRPDHILSIYQADDDAHQTPKSIVASMQPKQVVCIIAVYFKVQMVVLSLVIQQQSQSIAVTNDSISNHKFFFFFFMIFPVSCIPFGLLCLVLLFWYISHRQTCNAEMMVNHDRNPNTNMVNGIIILTTGIISFILLVGFQAAILMYAYHVTYHVTTL